MSSATWVSGTGGLHPALGLVPVRRRGRVPDGCGANGPSGGGAKGATLRRGSWCWRLCATVAVAVLIIVVNSPEVLDGTRLGAGTWARVAIDAGAAWLIVRVAARSWQRRSP